MDASEEDLRRNIEALNANTEALARISSKQTNSGSRNSKKSSRPDSDAPQKFGSSLGIATRMINSHSSNLADHFKMLSSGSDGLVSGFNNIIRNIIGGAAIAHIIESGVSLVKTYQSLNDIGQSFNGSMIEMGIKVGEAGLPLGKFAEMMQKNSTVAAILATQNTMSKTSLGELQKQVRDNIEQFGFYGMSLDQIVGLTGDYTETLRLQNRTSGINKDQTAREVASFAQTISDFAKVTGKSREQIAKATMEAMHDVGFASRDFSQSQQDASKKAIAFAASLPGTAGDLLSKMLAQTIAYGSSIFSDEMQTFAQAGGAEFLGIMDSIGEKVNKGSFSDTDAADALKRMQNFYGSNKETLRIQAQAGNQQARQLLGTLQQLNGLNSAQYIAQKQQAERLKGLTELFAKIESKASELSGSFLKGLMIALQPLEEQFAGFAGADLFNDFKKHFESFGTSLGKFIVDFAKPENLKAWMGTIERIVSVGASIAAFGEILGKVLGAVVSSFSFVQETFNKIGGASIFHFDKLGDVLAAAVVGIILFRKTIMTVLTGFKQTLRVNAGVVELHGPTARGGNPLGETPNTRDPNKRGSVPEVTKPDTAKPRRSVPEVTKPIPAATKGVSGRTGERIGGAGRGIKGFLGKIFGGVTALGGSALGAVGGMGGGCLDGISEGIQGLTNKVDIHGVQADVNARMPTSAASKPVGMPTGAASKPVGTLGKTLARSGRLLLGTASLLKNITGAIPALLGYGIDQALGAVGVGQKDGGAELKDEDWKKLSAFQRIMSNEGRLIEAAGSFFGFGNLANEARTQRLVNERKQAGVDPIEPATPNTERDSQYMSMTDDNLNKQIQETADSIKELTSSRDDQKDILDSIGATNTINERIAELIAEQNAMTAVANRKKIDLQQRGNRTNEDSNAALAASN